MQQELRRALMRMGAGAQTRGPWFWIAFFSIMAIIFSYDLMQNWLYIAPCVHAGPVRFAFVLTAAAALAASCRPDFQASTLVGGVGGMLASLYGMWSVFDLWDAHEAGLTAVAGYPFGLDLATLSPALFHLTAPCSAGAPMPPADLAAESLQAGMIGIYAQSGGWYLIPDLHFGDPALVSFVMFVLFFFWSWSLLGARMLRTLGERAAQMQKENAQMREK